MAAPRVTVNTPSAEHALGRGRSVGLHGTTTCSEDDACGMHSCRPYFCSCRLTLLTNTFDSPGALPQS
jgi:hypothetical protein